MMVLGPGQPNPYHHLFDLATGEDLGPATNDQVAWSDRCEAIYGDALGGAFVVDTAGRLVRFGSWAGPGERAVFTDWPERHERGGGGGGPS